jgi:hypothetical protein
MDTFVFFLIAVCHFLCRLILKWLCSSNTYRREDRVLDKCGEDEFGSKFCEYNVLTHYLKLTILRRHFLAIRWLLDTCIMWSTCGMVLFPHLLQWIRCPNRCGDGHINSCATLWQSEGTQCDERVWTACHLCQDRCRCPSPTRGLGGAC